MIRYVYNIYSAVWNDNSKRKRNVFGSKKKIASFNNLFDAEQFMFTQPLPKYLGGGKTKYTYYRLETLRY